MHVALCRLATAAGRDLAVFDVQPTHLDAIEEVLRATTAQYGMDTHPVLGKDMRLGRDSVLQEIQKMLTEDTPTE